MTKASPPKGVPSAVFEVLDPPSNGLLLLREKIDRRAAKSTRQLPSRILGIVALVGFIAIISLGGVLYFPSIPRRETNLFTTAVRRSTHPALVSYGLKDAPRAELVVPSGQTSHQAVLPIGQNSTQVSLYWMATIPTRE